MSSTSNTTFNLFPNPNRSLLKSGNHPAIFAGVTPSSTAALIRSLEDNQKNWHIYINHKGFHNHSAHVVLALWALGADASVIEAGYKLNSPIGRASFTSPNAITAKNWKDHLGDEKFYNAYLTFFIEEIKAKGPAACLEEYVFSPSANVGEKEPAMVSRFMDGLIHPFIHAGYGFEFGLPGIVAEGLAQTAVHQTKAWNVIPRSLFQSDLSTKLKTSASLKDKKPVHALSILARIAADPRFAGQPELPGIAIYQSTHDKHGEAIYKYVDQWTLEGESVEKKVEELVWMCAVIYGVGGLQGGKEFNADFFQMHFVTSSIFLTSLVDQLSRSSQEIMLKAYLATVLVWYIGRGRPSIDISNFYQQSPPIPSIPGQHPSPNTNAFPSPTSPLAITPNPWLALLQTALVHPSDHFVKLIRALAHFAGMYGGVGSGYFDSAGVELEGAGMLDGTIFVRAAGMTAARVGWVREGEAPRDWDRHGFYSS